MAVVKLKPTSPGRRAMVKVVNRALHKGRPLDALTESKKRGSGRNNLGHITTRHRGGGHKRQYRIVDFRRDKDGMAAKVERIEYDPNRSANLALLCYADGERRYILAPRGVTAGASADVRLRGADQAGQHAADPQHSARIGDPLHRDAARQGRADRSLGRWLGAVAGPRGHLRAIRLRSGEIRRVHIECRATIGEVGNEEHNLRQIGKAGATRWRGIRPTVRGVAMNPIDHPHGGGEGRTGEARVPVNPWGKPTKGYKTRRNKRTSTMIVSRRKKK